MLLKEIIDFKNGRKKPSSEGSIPIYGGNGVLGYTDQNNQEGESLIIGRVGAYCGCVYSHYGKCWISDNAIVGKVKDGNDFYYCYYLLKRLNLNSRHVGSGQPLMTQEILNNIEINICDYETQRKIGKILKNIDDKIISNNEINNNLYKLCNSLFHEYLDKYESDIEYKKIVDIAKKIVTGKTPSTANKEFWDGNIPFITIPDMHNEVFTIKTERNITELGAKSIIPKNSISVSCIATIGLVSINTEDSQTNQQINSIVIENDYDLYFLFEYLSEQEEYMKSIAGGTTTYNINKNTFENIEVPYLPKDILMEFNNSVSSMFEKIKLNQYENERLSQLRDTLLPKLMNGEIDLDNIEI